MEEAGDDGGEGEGAEAGGEAVQDAVQAELEGEAEHGGDVAVGEGAADGDGEVETGDSDAALEEDADAVNGLGGKFERLAMVLRRMRLPSRQAWRRRMAGGLLRFGDGLDVEGHGTYMETDVFLNDLYQKGHKSVK